MMQTQRDNAEGDGAALLLLIAASGLILLVGVVGAVWIFLR